MAMHDHLESDPEFVPRRSADWDGLGDDAEVEDTEPDDPETWNGFEDADEGGLDDLFGPWLSDDDVVAGAGWRLTVPSRGFFRD